MQLQQPAARVPIAVMGDIGGFIPQASYRMPGWIADALMLAADAIIIANSADDILFFNHASEEMFGYRSAELADRDLQALVPGWREMFAASRFRHPIGNATGFTADVIACRRDGSRFTAELSVATANSRGAQLDILILRDPSKRIRGERAVQHKHISAVNADTLLLQELRHRMKNTFQVLLSMIHLQKARPLGLEALAELQDMENRVHALNGVDGELAFAGENQPIALSVYVRHLADGLAAVFCSVSTPVAFRVMLDDIDVPAKTAAYLGLLINEAITNSFKHAVPKGATEIALTIVSQAGDILLTISDNGPGADPTDEAHVGGTGLMRALARQLGATLECGQLRPGMQYVVRLPAPHP